MLLFENEVTFIMEVKDKKRFYIDVAIILGLMFGFGFIPPIDPITPHGMRVLGILFGCIYAWTIGSQVWPSLVALLALGFLPGNNVTAVFSSAFGNQTLLMVVFCLIFCNAVENCGLLSVIANKILSMKFMRKGPWWMAFGFFVASCITSAFVGQPAVSIFLWAIFFDIIRKTSLEAKTPYVAVVMIGITICGYAGNAIMPFGAFVQIGVAVMSAVVPGFVMNYLAYSLMVLIICIILCPALTLFFKLICPKFDFEVPEDIVDTNNTGLTFVQKITLASVAFVVFLLTAPSFMPVEWAITAPLKNFGVTGGMCLTSVLLMLIVVNDKSIGDISGAMRKLPWDLYFLLAAALTISGFITAEGTGITKFLQTIFTPLLADKPVLVFLAILVFVGCVITNCLNNVVTYTILIPVSMAFAGAYGVNPELIVAMFAVILYQGLVLPSGSILGALLHANKDWLTAKQIYIYASLGELLLATVVVLVLPIAMNFLF